MFILIFIYIHVWWQYVFLYFLPYSDIYSGLDILILSGYISLYTCTLLLLTNKCSRDLNEWSGNCFLFMISTSTFAYKYIMTVIISILLLFSEFPFSLGIFFSQKKSPCLVELHNDLHWNTYPLKSLSFADYDSRPRIIRIPCSFVTTMSFTVHGDSREDPVSCRGLPPTRVWPLAASDRTHHDTRGRWPTELGNQNWWTLHVWFLSLLHLMKHS